ncbi:MAG: hypothetical protein H7263_04400 [Candidatus Sericytochromatia bacterium]|nr:hypothetical protein [Candidatus Sericytochromatia bacterium]
MIQKEILGYSIYFKSLEEAEKFYKKIPETFDPSFNKDDKEVMLLGVEPVKKEDFSYVFKKEGKKVSIEPLKIEFLETIFVRKEAIG